MRCLVEILDDVILENNYYGYDLFDPEVLAYIYTTDTRVDVLQTLRKIINTDHPDVKILGRLVEDLERDLPKVLQSLRDEYGPLLIELNGGGEMIALHMMKAVKDTDDKVVAIDNEAGRIVNWKDAQDLVKEYKPRAIGLRTLIRLHGGDILTSLHNQPYVKNYGRILSLCDYFFTHRKEWDYLSTWLQAVAGRYEDPTNRLKINAPRDISIGKNRRVWVEKDVLEVLEEHGFIKDLRFDKDYIGFVYENDFARSSLLVKGTWLEMYVYILAIQSGHFDEVYMSVTLDWDGKPDPFNVVNEIDVVMMKENLPIFVSCKMSNPSVEAINELAVYARQFLGPRHRAGLVTLENLDRGYEILKNRMEEMDLFLIDENHLHRDSLQAVFDAL